MYAARGRHEFDYPNLRPLENNARDRRTVAPQAIDSQDRRDMSLEAHPNSLNAREQNSLGPVVHRRTG
jgi:hypothetical protein